MVSTGVAAPHNPTSHSTSTYSDGDEGTVRIRNLYLTNGDDESFNDDYGSPMTPNSIDDRAFNNITLNLSSTKKDDDANSSTAPVVLKSSSLRGVAVKPSGTSSTPLLPPKSIPVGKPNRRVSIGVLPLTLNAADFSSTKPKNIEPNATPVPATPNDDSTAHSNETEEKSGSSPKQVQQAPTTASTSASGAKPAKSDRVPPPLPPKVLKNPAVTGKNKTPGMGLTKLRKLISQKRIRFQDGKFDLDLSYVTPQIIAMGLPAQGLSSLFRNPLSSVASMLSEYHKDSFMLINLTENSYSHGPFHDHVVDIGWEDHHAPPLHALAKVVVAAATWMALKPENVVAVHCKAGKGRTGTVIAALLVYAGIFDDPDEAFAYFAYRRAHLFHKGGVTIPSQRRSVHELCAILKGASPLPRPVILHKISFFGVPSKDQKKTVEAYAKVLFENKEVVKTSKESIVKLARHGVNTSNSGASDLNKDITAGDNDSQSDGDDVHVKTPIGRSKENANGHSTQPGFEYLDQLILDLPLQGDYLLKVKAKKPALMKQDNIFRINLSTSLLFPSIDANNELARESEEGDRGASATSDLSSAHAKTQTLSMANSGSASTGDVHLSLNAGGNGDDSDDEEITSPVYQEAAPVKVSSVTPSGAKSDCGLGYRFVFFRRDCDGAHKRKGFPDQFHVELHFKEPSWGETVAGFQSCDHLGPGNVPHRPISFWDHPDVSALPSFFDSVWESHHDYQTELESDPSSKATKAAERKMISAYLSSVRKFAYLRFKQEKPMKVEKGKPANSLTFEPDSLWRELMSVRLRSRFSEVAQTSGLLPYVNDDAQFMIDNIVTAAKNARKPTSYTAEIKKIPSPTV